MTTKKKSHFIRTIKNIIFMVPALFRIISNISMLMKYEARLAGKSLVVVLICTILFSSLLISTWLCALALIFVYLTSLKLSALLALFIILMLNIVLLAIIAMVISSAKKNLTFPETSRQISRLTRLDM